MRRRKHPRKWNFKGHGSWAFLVGKANSRNSQENSQQTTREHTLSRPLFPAVYGLEILPSHKSHTQTLPSGFWGWDLERGWDLNVATSSNDFKRNIDVFSIQLHLAKSSPSYSSSSSLSSSSSSFIHYSAQVSKHLRSFSAIRWFKTKRQRGAKEPILGMLLLECFF